jgi:hypothetical protein
MRYAALWLATVTLATVLLVWLLQWLDEREEDKWRR